nr:MAG TPA: DNA primase [Caudoviricetes sp.]
MITTSDIVQLVSKFGIPETSIRYYNNQLIMPTGCHNEIIGTAKHKLYYYEDSKKFHCYTCCGSMNPFEFVVQAYRTRGIKYSLSNAAIIIERIIQERLRDGFAVVTPPSNVKKEIEEDWHKSLTEYNPSIMNCFSRNKKYLKVWEKEGISFDAMDKFGIKFDMIRNRMVIPIYDDKGVFVGAKVRNFNQEDIENGRKYMPLIHNNEIYTYDKGKILYGLNFNKKNIKNAKRAIIFESEKSTILYESLYVGNKAVSIGGSNISIYQAELLKQYKVETVVLALDNDYSLLPNENGEYDKYFGLYKMLKEANKLDAKGFNVEIVYDWEQSFLENKDAPIDKGREIWNKLYRNRKNFNELKEKYLKKGEKDERTKVEIEDF